MKGFTDLFRYQCISTIKKTRAPPAGRGSPLQGNPDRLRSNPPLSFGLQPQSPGASRLGSSGLCVGALGPGVIWNSARASAEESVQPPRDQEEDRNGRASELEWKTGRLELLDGAGPRRRLSCGSSFHGSNTFLFLATPICGGLPLFS